MFARRDLEGERRREVSDVDGGRGERSAASVCPPSVSRRRPTLTAALPLSVEHAGHARAEPAGEVDHGAEEPVVAEATLEKVEYPSESWAPDPEVLDRVRRESADREGGRTGGGSGHGRPARRPVRRPLDRVAVGRVGGGVGRVPGQYDLRPAPGRAVSAVGAAGGAVGRVKRP